jgi:hypothetical protein
MIMHGRMTPLSQLAATMLLVSNCTLASEGRATKEAEASLQSWLAFVDEGQYETAWRQSASELQGRSTVAKWVDLVTSARPAGKVVRRKVVSRKYLDRLGTGPPGRYVNIVSLASLESGRTFGELTTMIESDGRWRVYGYKVVGAQKAPAP